jgi:hypothetical protein
MMDGQRAADQPAEEGQPTLPDREDVGGPLDVGGAVGAVGQEPGDDVADAGAEEAPEQREQTGLLGDVGSPPKRS